MFAVLVAPPDALPAVAAEPTSPGQAYALYFGLVFRNLRRLGIDQEAIEDAVQDVFVVVFRRWDEFAKRSSLRTWIFGIVVRVARDYRRARRRRLARLDRARQEAEVRPPVESPDADAERREATRLLHSVLDRLDEEQRTLIVLVDLEEISTGEAAEIMNLNPSTCRGKLAGARRAFAAAVESFGSVQAFDRSPR